MFIEKFVLLIELILFISWGVSVVNRYSEIITIYITNWNGEFKIRKMVKSDHSLVSTIHHIKYFENNYDLWCYIILNVKRIDVRYESCVVFKNKIPN